MCIRFVMCVKLYAYVLLGVTKDDDDNDDDDEINVDDSRSRSTANIVNVTFELVSETSQHATEALTSVQASTTTVNR